VPAIGEGDQRPLPAIIVGGFRHSAMPAMKSCRGIGATAAFTASSNRSNSTSLMALSGIRTPSVAKVPFFAIERTPQIVIDPVNAAGLVDEVLTAGGRDCWHLALLHQRIAVPAALPGRRLHHASAACRIRTQPNDAVSAHYASRRVITGCLRQFTKTLRRTATL
jgi:hypothetical protein